MTTPKPRGLGFMADLTPETQAKRARQSGSHWRKEAAADTEKARWSFVRYAAKGKAK